MFSLYDSSSGDVHLKDLIKNGKMNTGAFGVWLVNFRSFTMKTDIKFFFLQQQV